MSVTKRYCFKPKGAGYTRWVTVNVDTKFKKAHNKSNQLENAVISYCASGIAKLVFGKKENFCYRIGKDPSGYFKRRQKADAALERELDVPNNNVYGGYKMDSFDRKIIDIFPGKIVRKDLTTLMKKGANVPTYVLEYLLGMYCATDDEEAIEIGLTKIKKILSENYVRPDQSEYVKSKIKENGQYTIIDKSRLFLTTVRISMLQSLRICVWIRLKFLQI
ncbi:MAG: hypothetical protein KBT46_09005 [Ruminococcus sp.]|nr:hypothetical protein [Candidatus Copronaster equi]